MPRSAARPRSTLPAGKNLVGAFWQPRAGRVRRSRRSRRCPPRERRAGFGELWKYALLDGPRAVAARSSTVRRGRARVGHTSPRGAARGDRARDRVQGGDRRARRARAHRPPRAAQPRPHRRATRSRRADGASSTARRSASAWSPRVGCRPRSGSPAPTWRPRSRRRSAAPGYPTDPDAYLSSPVGDEVLARLRVDKKRVGDQRAIHRRCAR